MYCKTSTNIPVSLRQFPANLTRSETRSHQIEVDLSVRGTATREVHWRCTGLTVHSTGLAFLCPKMKSAKHIFIALFMSKTLKESYHSIILFLLSVHVQTVHGHQVIKQVCLQSGTSTNSSTHMTSLLLQF